MFEKAISFVENLKENEKVILIYHDDCDGVCSAVLMISVLEAFGKKVLEKVPMGVEKIKDFDKIVKGFDKIILLDLPTASLKEKFENIQKDVLIIDHHPCEEIKSEKIFLVNPLVEKPNVYQPTSYLVYKAFVDKIKKRKWVACVGTVGDFGVKDCRDLVKIKNEKEIWKSKFGRLANVVNSCLAVLGVEKTLEKILSSRSLNDFLKEKEVISAVKEFEKELEKCEKELENNAEIYGKVLISEIKPKYKRVGSALATKIATNYDKIIIIFEEVGNLVKVHGRYRNKDEIHLGKIFEEIGIGGGHRNASGGIVKKKEKNMVKVKILKKLKDFSGFKS